MTVIEFPLPLIDCTGFAGWRQTIKEKPPHLHKNIPFPRPTHFKNSTQHMKKIQKITTALILLNSKPYITLVLGLDFLSYQQHFSSNSTCTQDLKIYIKSTLHLPANVEFFPTVHVGNHMPKEGQIIKSTHHNLGFVIQLCEKTRVICQYKDGLIQCTVDSQYCNDNEATSIEQTQMPKVVFESDISNRHSKQN